MMFGRLFIEHEAPAARDALITSGGRTTWGALADRAEACRSRFADLAGRRVGLQLTATAPTLAALAALDLLAADVFLLDAGQPLEEAVKLGRELSLAAVIGSDEHAGDGLSLEPVLDDGGGSGGSVTILTSGSTGRPKAARHTWSSLARPVRKMGAGEAPRWLLTYRPNLYAGLQVVLQCFCNGGTLVAPATGAAAADVAALMRAAGVQYVSGTPSYLRRLLMFAPHDVLRQAPLRQITLGGEVIDQPLLDALAELYPDARLVHIYATTELGRCFSVTDGHAGFPRRFLDARSPDGIELGINDGELIVRSENAMQGYDRCGGAQAHKTGEWFHTGDLVEVRNDRVYFIGRKSDIINVGGNKVHPVEVERVIRQVPGVLDVRVFGRKTSITGELVVCEVVAAESEDAAAMQQRIGAYCTAHLSSFQRPRLVHIVKQIAIADSGKKIRRREA